MPGKSGKKCTKSSETSKEGHDQLDVRSPSIQAFHGDCADDGSGNGDQARAKNGIRQQDSDRGYVCIVTGSEDRKTIEKLQKDVDEITDIVRVGVDIIVDRGEKISDLELTSDKLVQSAREFKRTGRKLLLKYYIRKYPCYFTLIILVVLIVLAISCVSLWWLCSIRKR